MYRSITDRSEPVRYRDPVPGIPRLLRESPEPARGVGNGQDLRQLRLEALIGCYAGGTGAG